MMKGGVRQVKERFYARARYGEDARLEVCVPWAKTKEDALERANIIAELAEELAGVGRRDLVKATAKQAAEATTPARLDLVRKAVRAIALGAKPRDAGAVLFKEWAKLWTDGELRRRYPDHVRAKKDFSDELSRLKAYINPIVGEVPLYVFERAHADQVMNKLPAELAPATRRHVAQIMVRLLNLAVHPGGHVTHSPLPRGYLPKLPKRRLYHFLYPVEETKLLGGEADEGFRLFCGILDREGMRVSELVESEWWQWNLRECTFTANRTKTGDPRIWALRPDVAEAMKHWSLRKKAVLKRPFAEVAPTENAKTHLAETFRNELRAAGVDREELYNTTETMGRLRAHDMRATFVTISLAEGKSDTWIRDRTGHTTVAMVDRYRRAARHVQELQLGSLTNLVKALGWGKGGGKERGRCESEQAQVAGSAREGNRTPMPLGGGT